MCIGKRSYTRPPALLTFGTYHERQNGVLSDGHRGGVVEGLCRHALLRLAKSAADGLELGTKVVDLEPPSGGADVGLRLR